MIFKIVLYQGLHPSIKTFTTEFCQSYDFEFRFGIENLKSWLLPQTFTKKTFFVKNHFKYAFLDLTNKKSSKKFKFCKIGGFTGILNKLIFLKINSDFKNSIFYPFSLN